MNTVRWNVFNDAVVNSFNVYRAVTGVVITFPNAIVAGDRFLFAATSPQVQLVTLTSGTPTIASVAADITTQARGVKVTVVGNELFIRCTARENPKLKLLDCPFLAHAGQGARIIIPANEWIPIASVPFVAGQFSYTHGDTGGDPLDWYHVTSVTAGVESIPSQNQQALIVPEDFCVVEGRVIDLQNNPIAGAEVKATVMIPVGVSDNSGIIKKSKTVVSDELGRWNLPILQGQQVLFEIPLIGYNQVVLIPTQAYILFKDLVPLNDHYFAPAGETSIGI